MFRRVAVVCCSLLASCSLTHADATPSLELSIADADVWAYDLTVTGQLLGDGELAACQTQVAGKLYEAQLTTTRSFRAQLRLAPGDNAVTAHCRLRGSQRLAAAARHYRVRLSAAPIAVARAIQFSDSIRLDATSSTANPGTGRPIVRYEWYAGELDTLDARLGGNAHLVIPRPAQAQRYTLRVADDRGEHDLARVLVQADGAHDDELRDAVVYGVLPPLYGSQPLQAVTQSLPSLSDLGVDVLWLAPLFRTPPGDFGYAVTDYFDVRQDYGSSQELHELVARAHALGLRVLLDLPVSQSSREHPYFLEAKKLGPRSHYFDFYTRDSASELTPSFNYHNPEVARFIQEAAKYWLDVYNLDGYRLDDAWDIRQREPTLWPQLKAAVDRSHPQHLLIAEAPARDDYYTPPLFAAAYDWTREPGVHAWKDVFQPRPGIAQRLAAALRASGDKVRPLRFLNNSDTGARFITRYGRDMTRVATAALLTLPGLPCLYSFDEVGAAFEPNSSLTPITARDDELLAFHQRWIRLRHEERALSGTGFELLYAGEHNEVLAFLRYDGDEPALVVLNFSSKPARIRLTLDPRRWPSEHALELGGPTHKLDRNVLDVKANGWDTRLFKPH